MERVRRGDIVFAWSPTPALPDVGEGVMGPITESLVGIRVASVSVELIECEVYGLEVEGAHSFITETCVVNDCARGTTARSALAS